MSILIVTSGVPFGSTDQGLAAQTSVTFVKNIGQPTELIDIVDNPQNRVGYYVASRRDVSQALGFTTGSNSGGYTLESLTVEILAASGSSTYEPGITIHTDSSGLPATAALYTLIPPSPLPTGAGTFEATNDANVVTLEMTAPDDATLTARTTYWVVFKNTATQTSANRYEINPTTATAEDSGGLTGWSIADMRHRSDDQGTTWTASGGAFQMELKGTEAEDMSGVTVTPTELTIVEGDTGTYTVALNAAPTQQVTVTPTVPAGLSISPTSLTFSADDFGAKTLTVTAEHDMDLVSETGLSITHAVSGYGEITTADAVTVDVTDDDVAGITVDPTTLAVNEGMTAQYTVVLDFQPADDVTVTPSVTANRGLTLDLTSLTFTTTNWDVPQEVTVTAADDTNNANETATITHTADETGAGTAYDLAASAIDSISVTVNDNDVITLSETALTIAEGMSGSYTVALAQAPSSTVTVTLTLSADSGVTVDTDSMMAGDQHTLSFTTGNWSTAQTVTVTAPQDDDGFSNTGTITHTVSGGGLRGSATLTTAVTEDETVGLVLGGSATLPDGQTNYVMSVNENSNSGSSNQYTVQLASQPFPTNQNVTVTVTAPAGQANLKKTGQTTASKSVVLTFTGLNWNTAQTITVDAADDPDSAAATYSLTHSMSGANFTGSGPNLELTVIDLDTPGLVLSKTALEIDETNAVVTETYTVKLATQPSADVTVTLTQPTNTDVTVSPGMLTFTNSNWNTERTVTVSIAADADAGNESATIVHSVSQTSGDMEYGAAQNRDVSVTIDDDEVATVSIGTASATLTEPETGTATSTYKIILSAPPTNPVTVVLTVAGVVPPVVTGQVWTNPDVTVSPSSVTFTDSNWSAGETITVSASPDDDGEDDTARIGHTVTQLSGAMEFDGKSAASVEVDVTDTDTPQVEFRRGSSGNFSPNPALSGNEGGTASYSARLTTRPRGTVNLTVTAPTGFVVTPATLTFTPSEWTSALAKEFMVTIPTDDNSYDETVTFNHAVSGYGRGTVANLPFTVDDDDAVRAMLDPADGMVTVDEGMSSTYKIKLTSRPSTSTGAVGTVSVAITSNTSKVTVNPPTVTLNSGNWQTGRTVTVLAAEDADGVPDTAILSHIATSASGGDYNNVAIDNVTVTVTDNDEVDVILTPAAVTFMEGTGGAAYSVTLATQPTDAVTVMIVNPSDNSDVTTQQRSLTFNASNYNTPHPVNVLSSTDVDTADDTATITHTVSQSGGSSEYDGFAADDVAVTVTDPDRSRVSTSPSGFLTVQEESTATYRVRITHAPASGDTVTVNFALTRQNPSTGSTLITFDADSGTTGDQTALTFTASDYNTWKTVTVRGVADANLVDETFRIVHSLTGNRVASATAFMNITRSDNDRANLDLGTTSALTITEGSSSSYDIKLTQQPSATVTLTVTATGNDDVRFSTDSCSTLTTTGTLEFTTSNWNTAKSLTVCGAEDYDAADDEGASLTYSASGGGYSAVSYPATSVVVDDNDEEGVTISPTAVEITEVEGAAATGTYMVSLSAAPTVGSVTVSIAVTNNPDVTTSPTSLTFSLSDWTAAVTDNTVTKAVEIRVADDDGADDEVASISHTLGGTSYGPGTTLDGVEVTVTDTDMRGVTIVAVNPFSFNEGGSATYTVVLDTEPTGPVTVNIVDAITTDEIQTDKTALEFTIGNWNTAQTVTVSAAADDDAQDDTGTITHEVTRADYGTNMVTADSVAVTVTDLNVRKVDLRIGGVENPTSLAFSVGEGASDEVYEIKLGTKPVNADGTDGEVTITVTTSDSSELRIRDLGTTPIVDSLTLTFNATNWNRYQSVSILAPDEPGDTSPDTVTIMHAVAGSDYGSNSVTAENIAVTINDDDSPSFSTSAASLNVTEGTSGSYTVVLDTLPVGGSVTITVSVGTNPDIRLVDGDNNDATELDLEFTTSNWNAAQTVTVRVAEDKDALVDTGSIRHVATGANFGGRVPDVTMDVTVQETTVAGVTIEPKQLTITEGRTGTYNVVLQSEPQSNVTVVLSSSNASKVTISPARLTFTNATWDDPQAITVSGVSDADANNDSATITHTSSGDIYDDVEIASVSVTVVEDGTAQRDTSSFLQSSSCEGEVRLTWNSPTAEGVEIASYQIQWRTGKAQYSTSLSVTETADATSYTLSSLTNGVSYTIRVLGLDGGGEPVWSRETTATPSAQSCIAEVRFGNILADSTPVIIDVGGAEPGTMVNMRYRSLNPGVWSDVQSKSVERGQTTVTFDIRGLEPEHDYEVQTWLGSNRPPVDDRASSAPMAVAQKIFRTTSLPEGVTFFGGGGGGGSIARIGRIEPSIRSVKLSAGDEVVLSVEVWGRQGLLDNGLADKAPADGRPEIAWSSSGGGTFEEGRVRSEWRDECCERPSR